MLIKLNDRQKRFLFDNDYVTAKVLDAEVYRGWENYFIDNFKWELETMENKYYMYPLYIKDKTGDYVYRVLLNFQNEDMALLMALK